MTDTACRTVSAPKTHRTGMRRFRGLYDGWLRSSPVLTKSVTSALLFGVADRIAQRVEKLKRRDQNDEHQQDDAGLERTARMMLWGGAIFAPIAHTWVNFVERKVGSSGAAVVIKKILLDMFVFAPNSNMLFFTTTKLMEGQSVGDAFDFAVQKIPKTMAANYMVWPLANVVTYGVVPLRYRILFINCVSMGWSTFLSMTSSEGRSEEKDREIALS
jgi:protein Mpv17